MKHFTGLKLLSLVVLLFLAACESSEERAERHFQSALSYIEQGDTARAIVEFRNVFKLNGLHKEARETYARLQASLGNTGEAYSQFLRLIEQFPDHFEGHLELAEMSLDNNNLEGAKRHGRLAHELNSESTRAQAVASFLDYSDAVDNDHQLGRDAALTRAEQLIILQPDLINAHRVLIRDQIAQKRWRGAIARIDDAIETTGHQETLNSVRYLALTEIGDPQAIEAHLLNMVARKPDDIPTLDLLVDWYVSVEAFDKAENFLREIVAKSGDKEIAEEELVNFIRETRGGDAAKAELVQLIEKSPERAPKFKSIGATIDFVSGETDQAITTLETLLQDAEASDQTDAIKIALSKMYKFTNNPVGARALAEEVLERRPNNTDALLERSEWLIKDDESRKALINLRAALGQSPNDPRILTMMANAHARDGNKDLKIEMLALAVTASRGAPAETLRYARVLVDEGKPGAAEEILSNALSIRPQHLEMLAAVTDMHIEMKEWRKADDTISRIAALDNTTAGGVANSLIVRKLKAQQRTEDLDRYLQALASQNNNLLRADLEIVQNRLDKNDLPGAFAHISKVEAGGKDLEIWKFVRARILAGTGDLNQAKTLFEDLLADAPDAVAIWVELYKVLRTEGDVEGARAMLDDALAQNPDAATLKVYKAGELELAQDFDGAIDIYEALYAQNSNSDFIANNLASLISMHRDDPKELNKAYTIARRFRSSNSPQALDTYGWLAHRVGKTSDGLPALQRAAILLPDEPSVAYHYGMALSASALTARAIPELERALELADKTNPPAFVAEVEAELKRLKAAALE